MQATLFSAADAVITWLAFFIIFDFQEEIKQLVLDALWLWVDISDTSVYYHCDPITPPALLPDVLNLEVPTLPVWCLPKQPCWGMANLTSTARARA